MKYKLLACLGLLLCGVAVAQENLTMPGFSPAEVSKEQLSEKMREALMPLTLKQRLIVMGMLRVDRNLSFPVALAMFAELEPDMQNGVLEMGGDWTLLYSLTPTLKGLPTYSDKPFEKVQFTVEMTNGFSKPIQAIKPTFDVKVDGVKNSILVHVDMLDFDPPLKPGEQFEASGYAFYDDLASRKLAKHPDTPITIFLHQVQILFEDGSVIEGQPKTLYQAL